MTRGHGGRLTVEHEEHATTKVIADITMSVAGDVNEPEPTPQHGLGDADEPRSPRQGTAADRGGVGRRPSDDQPARRGSRPAAC
jgi:hypothetical protein